MHVGGSVSGRSASGGSIAGESVSGGSVVGESVSVSVDSASGASAVTLVDGGAHVRRLDARRSGVR